MAGQLKNALVGGRYRVVSHLGSGSFGEVYLGVDIVTGSRLAVKAELVGRSFPQLHNEAEILKALRGGPGIPNLRWVGQEHDHKFIILDLLGPNLEDLFNRLSRKFSQKTIFLLADQMIRRLEYVHSRHFLHCDVKPENFLMGLGKFSNTVFLIDFGLSRSYVDPVTGQHLPYAENRKIPGTARYASLNAHLGREPSRRDDLESLGHILVYFNKGELPWQGIHFKVKKQRYEHIAECKFSTPLETLCENLPAEFLLYMKHCRGLGFDELPDYRYLRQLFQSSLRPATDLGFDWTRRCAKAAVASPPMHKNINLKYRIS